MERNEGFINLVTMIQSFEKQLEENEDLMKTIERTSAETEIKIEEHFEMCMNTLATRKAKLLSEHNLLVNNYKRDIKEMQDKIMHSLEGCNKALETGSFFYKSDCSTAERIWKSTTSVAVPRLELANIRVVLPTTLLGSITEHGTVKAGKSIRFSEVETVNSFSGSTTGFENGKGTNSKFDGPCSVCLSPNDHCLYVCDFKNSAIRKVTMQGDVSTVITKKGLLPYGIVLSYKNNELFVVDHYENAIYRVLLSGSISLFAKQSPHLLSIQESILPRGIAIDQSTGDLFISEASHKIRKVSAQGKVSSFIGCEKGFKDGNPKDAKFNKPRGLFFDAVDQSILVCDLGNNKLRKISANGEVTSLCYIDCPIAVEVTCNRTILVSSFHKSTIYKVTKQETGDYEAVVLVGGGKGCELNGPIGLAVDEASHACFVSEFRGNTIKKISFVN